MTTDTLAVSTGLALGTAALYLYIGFVLRQRQVSADAAMARDLFGAWWILLGVTGLLGVVQLILYTAGMLPIWLYMTFTQLALLLVFVALWALQCYLVYLYRGTRRAFVPLAWFYLAFYVFVLGLVQWVALEHPYTTLTDNGWTIRPEPRYEIGRGAGLVAALVLIGPQMVAAVAYARLFRKTRDRTQRYRIALLTGAILGWFGTSLLATAADASEGQAWQVISRLIGLAAGGIILAAYRPPAFVRRGFGIRSLDEESMPTRTTL
jgi:hypothetical protein